MQTNPIQSAPNNNCIINQSISIYAYTYEPWHLLNKLIKSTKSNHGSFEGYVNQYSNLGIVYVQRGNKSKAKESWQKCLELYTQIGIPHMAQKIQSRLDKLEED